MKPSQAGEAAGTTGLLLWMIPLALGLWMNKRYAYALEVLQRPGREGMAIWLIFILLGMVARQVPGNHELACDAYQRALDIEPNRHDTV